MNITTRILRCFFPVFFLTAMIIFPVCASAFTGPAKVAGMPIPFIEQQGQHVQFTARTFGGSATVTSDGQIIYTLSGKDGKSCVLAETPVRNLPASGIRGQGLLKAGATVFHGRDTKKTLRLFKSVNMGNVAQGIGLTLRACGYNVEKLYSVQPGADPAAIRMKIGAAGTLSISENGQLVVMTARGPVRFTAPVAYQKDPKGNKQTVQAAYKILSGNEYGFSVGAYDRARTLVIDPLLASTFLGGTGNGEEVAYDIALDSAGNVYVAGTTPSADFPVTDDSTLAGSSDGFIVKFNADLSELLAATFIGGSGDEAINSILVTEDGKVYAAGYSDSSDCPVTGGAYSEVIAGTALDLYLCVLNDSLTDIEAATYLGGTDIEYSPELALGSDGDLFVAMITCSTDFPMASPEGETPYQSTLSHSKNYYSDVAVARLSGDLTTLKASTFLGGSGSQYGYGYESYPRIALDASGDVWIAGMTEATDFPTTENAYRRTVTDGYYYAFVSRLNADLTTLEASTYLGCTHFSYPIALATGGGDVYVAGSAVKTGDDERYPVTEGAYDTMDDGDFHKCFISRLGADLTGLKYSTLLGGTQDQWCNSRIGDMKLDSTGNVVVVGQTTSTNFPTSENAYDRTADNSNSLFIARLDGSLGSLLAGTYLGGQTYDYLPGLGLALDSSDNVYLCGTTSSSEFPTTEGAYDTSFNSDQYNQDAFVSRLDSDLSRDISADLALSADTESLSVTAGDEATFTIDVENLGPDAASQVVLTIMLPDGVTFVSATPDQGTAVHDSGVITCEMGAIEASGGAGVFVVVQAPSNNGDLDASASVSAAQTDTDEDNNTLGITISVTGDDNSICFISTVGK